MSEFVIIHAILLHLKLMHLEMSENLFFLLKSPVIRGSSTNAGGTDEMTLRPSCFQDQTFILHI